MLEVLQKLKEEFNENEKKETFFLKELNVLLHSDLLLLLSAWNWYFLPAKITTLICILLCLVDTKQLYALATSIHVDTVF